VADGPQRPRLLQGTGCTVVAPLCAGFARSPEAAHPACGPRCEHPRKSIHSRRFLFGVSVSSPGPARSRGRHQSSGFPDPDLAVPTGQLFPDGICAIPRLSVRRPRRHHRGITAPALHALLALSDATICRNFAQPPGSGSSSPVSPIPNEFPASGRVLLPKLATACDRGGILGGPRGRRLHGPRGGHSGGGGHAGCRTEHRRT
jgi:hypothetical protein